MDVVTRILGRLADLRETVTATDRLVLTSEERSSAHFARTTEQGRGVRVSLPRGSEINDGDVLAIDGGVAIVASAAPEDLLSIAPQGAPVDWAAVGYQLGNLHRPVRFGQDRLLTPVDPAVEDLLRRLGVSFQRVHAPFVGRRYGAMTGHHHHDDGHGHGHHHGDDHGHDHGGGHGRRHEPHGHRRR